MEKTNVCESCKFWNETGASDAGLVGDCRRNSPAPITLNGSSEVSVRMAAWPATAEDQWCGDFEKRSMETKEVLERMATIEKMEAERKTK